ncbi:MAG: DUF2127 domain-containing protein [Gemmatimonadaceae bacterium]
MLIALFKFVKAALLVGIALAAFQLLRRGMGEAAERWLATVSSTAGRRALQHLLASVSSGGPARLELIGAGALAYAALFAVEGAGLWLRKRWAEYLTLIATATFVPVEIYELVKGLTLPRVLTLAINLAMIAYLAYRLRHPKS